jgi:hypothetical protein
MGYLICRQYIPVKQWHLPTTQHCIVLYLLHVPAHPYTVYISEDCNILVQHITCVNTELEMRGNNGMLMRSEAHLQALCSSI